MRGEAQLDPAAPATGHPHLEAYRAERVLDGTLRHAKRGGDGRIVHSLRDAGENGSLAGGQGREGLCDGLCGGHGFGPFRFRGERFPPPVLLTTK